LEVGETAIAPTAKAKPPARRFAYAIDSYIAVPVFMTRLAARAATPRWGDEMGVKLKPPSSMALMSIG
jgi:hypothetical protein